MPGREGRGLARSDRRFLALLVGLAALFAVQLRGPIDARWDGAVYYVLGTSLATGQGYRLLNEPGEIEAVQYPPLLPFVVAASQRALGTSDFVVVGTWLRWLYALLSLALAAATYLLAREYLPPRRAFAAGAITGLAVHVWYLAGVLYAEIPFSLVAVAFVLCARRADRTRYWLATAVLGAAGYLLRTAGLALLLAWVAEALLPRPGGRPLASRMRQATARAMVALLPVLAWQAWVGSVTSSPAYAHPTYPYQRAAYQYSNVTYVENMDLVSPFTPEAGRLTTRARIARVASNLAVVPASLGGAVTAQRAFWEMTIHVVNRRLLGRDVLPMSAALVPMSALGIVIIAGAAVMVRRREWLVPLACAASTASICLTPWPEQFVRYFTPMTPFLAIMLVLSVGLVVDRGAVAGLARWARHGIAFAVLALVLGQDAMVAAWTFLVQGTRPVVFEGADGRRVSGRMLFYDAPVAAMDQALSEVRRRARPGDVIATSTPHWAFLKTGVKAILPPMEADREVARRLLDAVPVRFVVLDELSHPGISQRYAAPAVAADGAAWDEVYRTDDGLARIYERRR